MRYISHDPSTGEVHLDFRNIDFMRYFRLQNFFMCIIGSIIGFLMWILYKPLLGFTLSININTIYVIFMGGGIMWFIFTTIICKKAGKTNHESARIAGRRGLFTFSVMLMCILISLASAGKIYWDQKFFFFLQYIMVGMIIEAIFVLPLDYGISYLQGHFKKKRFDSV